MKYQCSYNNHSVPYKTVLEPVSIKGSAIKFANSVSQCVCSLRLSSLSRPQVLADVPPPKPALSTVIARPVRKAPPTTIQDLRHFPEIAPFQEVIMEESAEEESRATPSERGWF